MSRKSLIFAGLLAFCLLLATAVPAFAATRKTALGGLPSTVAAVAYKGTATLSYSRSGHKYALAKAAVKIYRLSGKRWVYAAKAKTSSKGKFAVSLAGGYTYKVAYAGLRRHYKSCSWQVKVTPVPTSLEVDEESLSPSGDGSGATVTGSLWMAVGGDLLPLPGGHLVLSHDGTDTVLVADSDGLWAADGLEAGDYAVAYAGDRSHQSCSTTFTVATGALTEMTTDASSYTLLPGVETTTVSGHVQTDLGTGGTDWTPLAGVTVVIRDGDGNTALTVTSNESGDWSAEVGSGDWSADFDAVQGFVAGDGLTYNLASSSAGFSVSDHPTQDAYAEVSGDSEYLAGEPVSGTLALYDSSDAAIPLAGPATLEVLAWSDADDSYVSVDTITTDADGNWSVGLPLGDDYIVSYGENPDYVSGGIHYHVQEGGLSFAVVAELSE